MFTKEWGYGGRKYGTLHGLRHSCASLLLSAGVPPNVVQQRLGHRRIEITLSVYAVARASLKSTRSAKVELKKMRV